MVSHVTDAPPHLDGRTLSKSELRVAGEVARDAFVDDDLFKFLVPDDRRRARGLTVLHETVFRNLGPKGRLRTVRDADDRIIAVAAWLTTSGYPQSIGLQLRSVPGSIRALGSWKSLRRGNAYLVAGARAHAKEPHWYLWVIAVEPGWQRHGAGTLLIDEALAEVDQEGVAVYLETQTESNLAYYRRFGFELISTLRPNPDGPPLYPMRRPAR